MAIVSAKKLRRKGGLGTVSMRLSKMGFRSWFIPLLAIAIGAVGWWTRSVIETTLKSRIEQNLVTILDTDVAAHQLDELLADGQTEPGPAEPPGRRAIRLNEPEE